MSGKPNPTQIGQLRHCAAMVREFDNEIERLRDLIANSTKQLEDIQASRAVNAEKIVKLLDAMDCQSSGNFGYEGRIVWLLAELVDQARATGSAA